MTGGGRCLAVLRAGLLTTVQDLGRVGFAHLGVPRAGAVDPPALTLANRLVGNPPQAAGLEITLTGCTLRFNHATIVAVAGAPATVLRVDLRPVDMYVPVPVLAGRVVHIGPTRAGLRTYLAVAGGIDVPAILGSRSTDTLAKLGPAVVRDGDVLPVGRPSGTPAGVWFMPFPSPARPPLRLRIRLGPRDDWFTPAALRLLTTETYRVSPMTDRVGVRLLGSALTRLSAGELQSEGVVLGAVQVPANGVPLVFLADHPTLGGYPVVAVVDESDLPLLAQARPGTPVNFRLRGR
ncbi:MAG: hypothetical protein V7603_4660 [Micromonosporaceae bacterium]